MTRIRLKLGRRREIGLRPFYTILILPHSRSRFRKLHVSRAFVVTLASLAALLVIAVAFAPHLFFRVQSQNAALDRLSEQNEQLRDEREQFEIALRQVTEKLDDVEKRAGRLANELGVDELPSSRPAAGGESGRAFPGPAGSLWSQEIGAVRSRTESLEDSLEQLDGAFARRMRILATTPSGMPVDGWFSHGFGWRRDPFSGERQFHRGIDIVADGGTPIAAPADGVVSRALRVADLGKTLDISHGTGFVTRYAHLSEVLVRPGQRVRQGDVIGHVGSTGRSTGPHLHYEVFRDGRRVNPWKYLGQGRSR